MSKFKAGDKVKVKGSDRTFTIGVIIPGAATGKPIAWEYATNGITTIGQGMYLEEIEHVKPEPKFKVGDRVIANSMIYTDEEFTVTEVVSAEKSEHGHFYYKGEARFRGGVWEKYLTAAPREFRVGDLIRAEKGELVVAGRLAENIYSGLTIQALGWPLRSLERDKFTITLVEAAPEPVVDRFPLPEEPGLYISQAYVVFRLTEGGDWVEARVNGRIEKVKPETLKSEKHWPLGLVAEPVDK